MFLAQQVVLAEAASTQGWVGVTTLAAGGLLGFVALYRRARATLAKRRRARPMRSGPQISPLFPRQ